MMLGGGKDALLVLDPARCRPSLLTSVAAGSLSLGALVDEMLTAACSLVLGKLQTSKPDSKRTCNLRHPSSTLLSFSVVLPAVNSRTQR